MDGGEINAELDHFERIFTTSSLYQEIMTIYDGDEHGKFMERLDTRIRNHDRDIERMCNHHYQGFIDSIRELLQVRSQAHKLKTEVVRIDEEAQESAKQLLAKSEEMIKTRKVQSNISAAVDALTLCLPVLTTYSKLQSQMKDKRYYPALKTLEQLEHTYLPRVASYRFAQQMRDNIPRVREDIKQASMSDIKDFLEAIRWVSTRIGQVAMKRAALQYNMDPKVAVTRNERHGTLPPNPFTGETYEAQAEAQSDEEEELCAQDLIDFTSVYRCLHIYTVLGARDQFETYYREQRREQARLALQPPTNMHENLEAYRQYLYGVLGFFVIEDHVLNIGNGLVTRSYLGEVWEMASGKVVNNIRNHSSYCTDTYLMLNIKNLIMLFAHTLQNYGYTVNPLHELLLEVKDHYNEVLMQKWVQVFRDIFEKDNYHPVQVETPEEFSRITEIFPYRDRNLEQAQFPKRFPFSMMVPKVFQEVKVYISACLEFSEDLNLSQTEKEDMVRKSTNLLLTRTLSGCLATLIKRPGLRLLQLIQITINTLHLEHANVLLEHYVAKLTGSIEDSSKPGLGRLQGKAMFKDIRGEAEEQIYIALRLKIDEFLELASYDWMLAEPKGMSSSYVLDLIAFLTSTFTAFTNLPVRVAQTACMSACQYVAKSLMTMLLSEDVKQMSLAALEQVNLDVIQCEQFAATEPVEGFEEGALLMCFADLRQLLDLFMTEDWSTYLHDYGSENSKYLRVSPHNAIIVVEKLREGEKRGMFSILKRSDKKKLLETVLKQLKQLTQQHAS
ncbi:exocyst complex component 6B-like isoform X3 [Portunus trituberculatus]|uniref:exocyst complex component 6B-like isoform X3 n=1 Tax=Portunus trituberculatus TaxID=210409 RepID=UPI001E1CB069|nr:exocyst complex component 6B-like isoform X3 [Portunus trituberculatus]